MRLFGRPLRRYLKSVRRAPKYLWEIIECIRIFKAPWALLCSYVMRRPPEGNVIELRSGLRIFLSEDPLDVVTVVGIFLRRDYGVVAHDSRVIDIGANIGVFTLYAIHCGARLVHAYEPCTESFRVLVRNIEENGLGDRVKAFQVAVGAGPERRVFFPRRSNVLNTRPNDGASLEDCDEVALETFHTVVSRAGGAELVKLDCEGEEEHILADASDVTLSRVVEVRLEYHLGRGTAIIDSMLQRNFAVVRHWAVDPKGGLVWFDRLQRRALGH